MRLKRFSPDLVETENYKKWKNVGFNEVPEPDATVIPGQIIEAPMLMGAFRMSESPLIPVSPLAKALQVTLAPEISMGPFKQMEYSAPLSQTAGPIGEEAEVNLFEQMQAESAPRRAFNIGVGEMQRSIGGVANRLGYTDYGQSLVKSGEEIINANPIRPEEQGIITDIASSLPSTLPLMAAGIATGGLAASGAGALGAGKLGSALAAALAGSAVSTPLESALEAGSAYENAKVKGIDPNAAFDTTMKGNVTLLGASNIPEYAALFLPGPAKQAGKAGIKELVARLARVLGPAASEGLQEGEQEAISAKALGEEASYNPANWTPEQWRAARTGAVMGGVVGGAGTLAEALRQKVEQPPIPTGNQQQFWKDVNAAYAQGKQQELVRRNVPVTEQASEVTSEPAAVQQPEVKPTETPAPEFVTVTNGPYAGQRLGVVKRSGNSVKVVPVDEQGNPIPGKVEAKYGKKMVAPYVETPPAAAQAPADVAETTPKDTNIPPQEITPVVEDSAKPVEIEQPHIDDRTFEEVGDRKIKAYQFIHPELKDYIQGEAKRLKRELKDTIKGQRFIAEEGEIVGVKKYTSESIQRIQNITGASYNQIEDALDRIINNNGQENQALAKRIELIIDDNLSQGTRDFEGNELQPNQEYIQAKANLKNGADEVAQVIAEIEQRLVGMDETDPEYKPLVQTMELLKNTVNEGEVKPASQKEPWQMTRGEYYREEEKPETQTTENKPVENFPSQKTLEPHEEFNEATKAYEEYKIPEDAYVHGRADRQDLETGNVILATKKWSVADQYAGENGSKWMLRPNEDTKIFDATDYDERERVINDFYDDYKNDDFTSNNYDSDELARIAETGNKETLIGEMNPQSIVDTAGLWDNQDFVAWFYDKYGYDMVKTEDGAAIIDPTNVEAQRVGDKIAPSQNAPTSPEKEQGNIITPESTIEEHTQESAKTGGENEVTVENAFEQKQNIVRYDTKDTIRGRAIDLDAISRYPSSSYIAKITGLDQKYGLARKFMKNTLKNEMEYGRIMDVSEGDIIEMSLQNSKKSRPDREYFKVQKIDDSGIDMIPLSLDDVKNHFKAASVEAKPSVARMIPIENARAPKLQPVPPFSVKKNDEGNGWLMVDATGQPWGSSITQEGAQRMADEANGRQKSIPDESQAKSSKQSTSKNSEKGVESKQEEQSASGKIANYVVSQLEEGKSITSNDLFKVSDEAFGGTQAQKKYTSKDAYDALELGVNKYLLKHKNSVGLIVSVDIAKTNLEKIRNKILSKIPTQTKRTEEQDEFQQFSTPPNLSYVAAWAANIYPNDVVLEPSAGTGGLAIFAKTAGAKVIVNELSPRRAALLKELNFDRLFTENAEQLHNILPDDVKPTVVIMNPPFSSTAGRMQGKNNTKNAIPHVEQALKRLEDGGRLVAIVGRGMADNSPTFHNWWKEIKGKYNVRANIGINGKNYVKYGTSFDVQLVVIDKTGPTQGKTITDNVTNLEDALTLLEVVKNDRKDRSTDIETKPAAAQSIGQVIPEKGEAESRSDNAVFVSVDRVGTGKGQGKGGGRKQPKRDSGTAGSDQETNVLRQSGESNEPADKTGAGRGEPTSNLDRTQGIDETTNAGRSSGVSSGSIESVSAGTRGIDTRIGSGIKVEATETKPVTADLSDAVYAIYQPQKLKIPGAKPHPGNLAQSAAMAAVEPPTPTYTPNLPKELIEKGKLSIAQLEPIVYAGQAHEQVLPDGKRKGFFIGDGTGVGKGREIAGIILDNYRQGRKKAVWISKNSPLFADAQRDFGNIGGSIKLLFNLSKIKPGTQIQQKEGILFTTYNTLGQGLDTSVYREGEVQVRNRGEQKSRLDQIVEWLGKDFDGVIAFDEAHCMQNSISLKHKRGMKKPADMALAGIELQKRLPNARVVYVSATGATEVSNLAYAERLGLWGKGTPFANKHDFISRIQDGGLAAMELVARDMKAIGVYIARNLSFEDVTYGTLEHKLTPEQTEIYDELARAWQIVLQNVEKALEETGQKNNGDAKGRALSKFWGSQQRFFNQILTSMQMPSVIEQVEKDIKNGHAVVMQLVNTNEATQNRQLAKMQEEDSLEDLDITPRDILMQYLDKSFPTQQYEKYTDDEGNKRSRPVFDSEGNPVQNREALEIKEELMTRLGAIKVPEGPLEIVLNHFGPENVAEVTGRTRRVVRIPDEYGRKVAKVERRTPKHAAADAAAFMEDKKKILIFSDAGGTGRSYHADLQAKNQRHRIHYLIQAGWRADNAVQGFGRTHRTNQASAPHYILVTTDLKGQKRFISSIARRLDQLGALTKGQRQTGSQGLFNSRDNLESGLAKDALQRFFEDLTHNHIPGINAKELLKKMGLEKIVDKHSNLNNEAPELRDITKFLNRILALDSKEQNQVFDAFSERLDMFIERESANGTLDVGLENYRADKMRVVSESTVYTDEKSGAETKYVELEAGFKNEPFTFDEAAKLSALKGFYLNTRSGRIYAFRSKGSVTMANGSVVNSYMVYGRVKGQTENITEQQIRTGNWKEVSREDAKELWDKSVAEMPEYRYQKLHLITGALLPIWDRLPTGHVRVFRVKTDDGQLMLGRMINPHAVDITLKKLGAGQGKPQFTPKQIVDKVLDEGYSVHLANGWRIERRRVSGEYRIEIFGDNLASHMNQLRNEGVFTERIDWNTRFFIPTGDQAVEVFNNVTKYRPINEILPPGTKSPNVLEKNEVFAFATNKKSKATIKNPVAINDTPENLKTFSPKATREISETLAKALNTVLRAGRVSRSLRGAFGTFSKKTQTGRIRNQKIDNWRVMGHELGHALQFAGGFKGDAKELRRLAEMYYPGKIPKGKESSEGLAEFLVLWFVDNAKAHSEAPKTCNMLDTFLDTHPELATAFNEAKAIAEADLETGGLAKWANAILRPGEKLKQNVGEEYSIPFRKRLTFALIDFTIPLKDLYEAAVAEGYDGMNPATLAAISGMVKDQAIDLFKNPARDKAGRFLIPGQRSLEDIVKEAEKLPGGIQLFDWIYHVLRYEERYQRGFRDAPFSEEVVKADAEEARQNHPEIVALVEEYSKALSEIILRSLVRAEVISEETAERIRKGSSWYLPLYHMGRSGKSGDIHRRAAGQVVKRYKGASTASMTFIEATMLKLADVCMAVEINRVMNSIEGTLRQPNMGVFGEIVDRPQVVKVIPEGMLKEQVGDFFDVSDNADDESRVIKLFMPGGISDVNVKEPILVSRHGDKLIYMRVAEDIYKSALSMKPIMLDTLGKILSGLSGITRAGALFNIRYITNALSRDLIAAGIQTKTPERSVVLGAIRGAIAAAGGDKKLMSLYISSGAYGSAAQESVKGFLQSIQDDSLRATDAPGWKRLAYKGTNIFARVVSAMGEPLRVLEEMQRVDEFEVYLKREVEKRGLTLDDIKNGNIPDDMAEEIEKMLVEAAYASREVATNFSLHGTHEGFRKYTRTVTFLQGGIQGVYREYRQWMGEDDSFQSRMKQAGKTMTSILFYMLPITLISWALSHDKDRYRDMPSESRDRYWWFPIGETGVFWFALAKPYGYGITMSIVERFLDWAYNQDDPNRRKPYTDLAEALNTAFGVQTISPAVEAILGVIANENSFGSPITPQREEGLPPELQYGPGNSKAAIKIAELMARIMGDKGPNPRQIDYVVNNIFGGFGKSGMRVLSGQSPFGSDRTGLEYTPIVGSLIYGPSEGGSRIVDKFYEDYNKAQMLHKAAQEWEKRGQKPNMKITDQDIKLIKAIPAMTAIANDLSKARRELQDINSDSKISADAKRIANLKYNWLSKVAAGYLYGRPVPPPPPETGITEPQIKDLLDYYENLCQKAIVRAMKTPGGAI